MYLGFYAMINLTILLRDLGIIKKLFVKNFESYFLSFHFYRFEWILNSTESIHSLRRKMAEYNKFIEFLLFIQQDQAHVCIDITDHAMNFIKSLSTLPTDKNDIEMKDLLTKYTNDIIMCVYGIKIDFTKDLTNKFYLYSKESLHVRNSHRKIYSSLNFSKILLNAQYKVSNQLRVEFFFKTLQKSRVIRNMLHVRIWYNEWWISRTKKVNKS